MSFAGDYTSGCLHWWLVSLSLLILVHRTNDYLEGMDFDGRMSEEDMKHRTYECSSLYLWGMCNFVFFCYALILTSLLGQWLRALESAGLPSVGKEIHYSFLKRDLDSKKGCDCGMVKFGELDKVCDIHFSFLYDG